MSVCTVIKCKCHVGEEESMRESDLHAAIVIYVKVEEIVIII